MELCGDVVVGVIDSGVLYTHIDLTNNMWTNSNEIPGNGIDDDNNGYIDDVFGINAITGSGDPNDDNDHGTHCAGTIAASGNDAGKSVGVAYNAKIMALKFLDRSGAGRTSDAIESIEYAIAHGASVLNNSWGGGGFSQGLYDAIEAANNAGILFVAAAGNSSSDNDLSPQYPASYDNQNVISVAAIDRNGSLAAFSNYGRESVDIAAPGVSILSTVSLSDNSYDYFNGTSMAAPHVAGVAALLLSEYPGASVLEMRNRLLDTTQRLDGLGNRIVSEGIVNASNAISVVDDGILEVRISASEMVSNQPSNVEVLVTDLLAVRNATVMGGFVGHAVSSFVDTGLFPDRTQGDGIYTARLNTPSDAENVTVGVNISAPNKQNTYAERSFLVSTPPSNDNFENRFLLGSGTTTYGQNKFATRESGEPVNPSVAGGRSVWWEWLAPVGLTSASFNTFGSNYDTTIAVYAGDSLDTLTLIAANDDRDGFQSEVTIVPTPGMVYQIQVDGYAGREGQIQLNYPESESESEFPSITTQPVNQATSIGAPFSLSVEATGRGPLTYQWAKFVGNTYITLPWATDRIFSVSNASIEDEGSYLVVVSNELGSVASQLAQVTVDRVVVAPSNDNFLESEHLTGTSARVVGTNILATGEVDEPNHNGNSGPLNSVWYNWTSPADGEVIIDTAGSGFDTTLAVYYGEAVDALALLASNDDYEGLGLQSKVVLNVSAGNRYKIAVDGFSSATGQIILNYHFLGATPINDDFHNASVMPNVGFVTGTNTAASSEEFEPNHGGVSFPISSVWWEWTAPSGKGVVTFDTRLSDYDTTLAVYEGLHIDELSLVAFNDDWDGLQSKLSFETDSNKTYKIVVDGYGNSEGNIVLDVTYQGRQSRDLDYSGDRIADFAIRNPLNQHHYFVRSNVWTVENTFFGALPSDIPISGDFDGDSLTDIAVFRQTTGTWLIKRSSNNSVFRLTFGNQPGDIAVPADYDGDGITDVAIRRPSSGRWMIRPSSNPSRLLTSVFGNQSEDIPVPADYDGDGKADIAVRRPSTGQFIYRKSSDGRLVRKTFGLQQTDIPVPADYDGDGLADIAVRRPDTGTWLVRFSGDDSIYRLYFGALKSDIPVPADYDGDGKADIAVRRTVKDSANTDARHIWLYRKSSTGVTWNFRWGIADNDIPLAAPIMMRIAMVNSALSNTTHSSHVSYSNHFLSEPVEVKEMSTLELLSHVEAIDEWIIPTWRDETIEDDGFEWLREVVSFDDRLTIQP